MISTRADIREQAINSIKAQMRKPDTDRYYDGGIIRGELTDRQLEEAERQQAKDARSDELKEVLACITQASESMVAASKWDRHHMLMSNLTEANGHLRCAHRNAPVGTDGLVMEHLRAAEAIVQATINYLEASR